MPFFHPFGGSLVLLSAVAMIGWGDWIPDWGICMVKNICPESYTTVTPHK